MNEAARLADALTKAVQEEDAEDNNIMVARWFVEDSAAELRRLVAINAELVEALEAALQKAKQQVEPEKTDIQPKKTYRQKVNEFLKSKDWP